MKAVFLLGLLFMVGFSMAAPEEHSRGCLYRMGQCVRECEEGTHAYTTGCGPLHPEPSCADLSPQPGPGIMCDFSACYCDPPTVRDTLSNTCVTIDKCPGVL